MTVDLAPKKKIFDYIKEELFDRLEARTLSDGSIELSHPETFRPMVILRKLAPKNELMEILFTEVVTPMGTIFYDQESIKARQRNSKDIGYSSQWADLFCELIMQNQTITQICQRQDMPDVATVGRWKARHPEFNEKLSVAYEMRGELLRDKAFEQSEAMLEDEKDNWQQRKAHVDHLLMFASKDAPKRYSNKLEVHNTQAPMILKLETGVRVPEQIPENLRQVKEISGQNANQIIEQLAALTKEPDAKND